jgi:hypothetical protein
MLVLFAARRSYITRHARQLMKPLLFVGISGRIGEFFVFLGLGSQFVRVLRHGDVLDLLLQPRQHARVPRMKGIDSNATW